MTKTINTPVVLIIFNRTDTLNQVVQALKLVQLQTLFIVSDGPRNEQERTRVEHVRRLAESVSALNTHKIYAETNKGLKRNLSGGLTEAFSNTDHLIVLEDDCVPSVDWLLACDKLNNELGIEQEIAAFCGASFLPASRGNRIWLSKKFSVWGWMAAAKIWQEFINSGFLEKTSSELWQEMPKPGILPPLARWEIGRIVKRLDSIDTWDVQFELFCISRGYRFLKPTKNMVTNVGFGDGATNTSDFGKSLSRQHSEQKLNFLPGPKKPSKWLDWLEHSNKFRLLTTELPKVLLQRFTSKK